MGLQKFLLGKNEDGSPHWLYVSDDPTKPVVLTGPVTGEVTTADGTVYNVTENVIEVAAAHNGEVSHQIGMMHEENGHPLHDDEHPFLHTCDGHCGDLTIKDKLVGGPLAAKRVASTEEALLSAAAPKGGSK